MNNFLQTLKSLGPAKLAAMGGVTLGMLAFFIFIITRLSTPSFGVLYSELDLSESSEIVSQLEGLSVEYQIRQDGAQILVPKDQVTRMRMTLAQEGLPSGGNIGNELFDDSDGLGSSSFMQNINRVRALEGELSRTVASLKNVGSARVHLVLPQRELFSRETREPSASIVLKMKGSSRLSKEQVSAVQHLAASAVPGLSPTQVSIIDDQGTLLARGYASSDQAGILGDSAVEKQQAYETRISREIEAMLSQTMGVGKVRATVRASMDFDQVRENSEIYDPDGQVVRSTQTVEEEIDEADRDKDDAVTVQGNIPEVVGEPLTGSSQGAGSFASQNRTEETVNYEISRIVREEVRETGVVKKLSVAVLVDGKYTTNAEGETVYEARTEDELEEIESIVKAAIGFDEERGDNIQISNQQFVDVLGGSSEPQAVLLGLDEDAVARIAEMLILAVAGILALLLIVRPLVTKMFEGSATGQLATMGPEGQILGETMQLQGGMAPPALTGPAGSTLPPAGVAEGGGAIAASGAEEASEALAIASQEPSELEEMINISQIEGKIKASSLKKIGEIIEKHPDEATNVIRGWLHDGAQPE